ncbi:MAG: dihydrolipoyllysine-residue succinyltransferase [bacterium]|jgi:2-oxoglutarate dehydrogenase E2 component (dihydrolipoamide succinyltransferase)
MAVQIRVPQLGESVVEGVVGKWHFAEGDKVERDVTLLEIETDKINLDIPCIATGTLAKILVPEGTTVEVDQLLGIITLEGESFDESMLGQAAAKPAEAPKPPAAPAPPQKAEISPAPAHTPSPVPTASGEEARDRLSPAVRRMIEEYKLDVNQIPGTGEGGRIRKIDVERFLADPSYRRTAAAAAASVPPAPAYEYKTAPAPKFVAGGSADYPEERQALTPIRKTIAQAMQRSKNTAAHTLDVGDMDCTNLVKFREAAKEEVLKEYGVKLTFMPFFVKAAVEALKKFPNCNASITESEVVYKRYYNIGIAVNTDAGLVVPNIKHADRKSIIEIAREIADLGQKARERKLTMEDISGGTFTLTNAGGYGVVLSSPIINYPEVAILGIHAIQKRPVVRDGEIVIRDMMYLALQFDHRLIDGVYAIQFRSEIQRLLETPELLLLNV